MATLLPTDPRLSRDRYRADALVELSCAREGLDISSSRNDAHNIPPYALIPKLPPIV